MTDVQAEYINTPKEGPYKPELISIKLSLVQ